MQLEHINCPICGGNNSKLLWKSKDFRYKICADPFNIVRCDSCNLLFLNPRPAKEDIAIFYPTDFHRQDCSLSYKIIEPLFKIAQESIINSIKNLKKNGKILDIGCGNGDFLLAMKGAGYDVWGIEPSRDSQRYCNEQLKGRIFYNTLEDTKLEQETFDIITMFHSLEHVYNLDGLFKGINRILKNDGIIFICVPDTDFFESKLFGPYYYNLEAPRHLYFFTKNSLSMLLDKYGFKPQKFIKETFSEIVCTPASFYHSLQYFLEDKKIHTGRLFRMLTFFPLAFVRIILRILFFNDKQNMKVLSVKKS